ncbi:ABC transporter permease [Neobacillus cucumis]|uniref:ABC transporter permease n=1 Tax=Neobacillus cucumis TaxID=1740721 RepID=UPI00203DC6A1|nr:ABC transporter permease [Neobacillus cucumis]MCM3729964.1 ABC transporter permease [Neobacillus cucumis]
MKKLMKIKMAWVPVWMPFLLILSMISIYLPVFKGADQKLNDFPLVIVNEDQNFAQSLDGKQILESLAQNHDGHSLKWISEKTKEDAIKDIKENKAYGAIIIPANYTSGIEKIDEALLAGNSVADPVKVEILLNDGGGQLATGVASAVLQGMASQSIATVSSQLQADLTKANKQVSAQAVSLIEHPIMVKTSNVLELPGDINKGLTPFMLVLMASITALLGTQMIHGYLSKIVEKMKEKGKIITETTARITELVLGVILMVVTASALMVVVFGFYNSVHSVSWGAIWLYAILCFLTLFFMFKMLSLIFGKWSMLVMFPVNILGIFASGGPIPLTGLPEFHRFFSELLPTRYMVDGMRSLLYFYGNTEAGLSTALWVIFSCLVVFMGICLIITYNTYKKEKVKQSVASPSEDKTYVAYNKELAYSVEEPNISISKEHVNIPSTPAVNATLITLLKEEKTNDEWYRQALLKFMDGESKNTSNTMHDDIFRNALLSINKQNELPVPESVNS